MAYRHFLFALLLAIKIPVAAQSNWNLNIDKNGIKVYTANTPTSKFKSIKVESVLEGTWPKLMAVILDVRNHNQWIYNIKNAYLIKKIGNNEIVYYSETSLPWPMDDRDAIIHLVIEPDSANNLYKIMASGEPDFLPKKEGLVRIPFYNARWEIKVVGKNKLSITYYLNVNPGGNLPTWAANMFSTKGPFETFSKLAALLKK